MAFWMASWARSALIPVAPKSLTLKTRGVEASLTAAGRQPQARTDRTVAASAKMFFFGIEILPGGDITMSSGRLATGKRLG